MAFENLKKRGIKDVLTMLKDHFLLIKDAVKSVNGVEADETGDIPLNVVPFAQNLESESSQRNYGYFIQRMAGGDTGLQDGSAWLLNLKGSNTHEGYVPEFLEMTVNAVERANPITAVIDRDTFVAYVSESGTITLVYSSGAWTTDPTLYGITVTGTPVDGDIITVDYTAEERGEIIVPNPQALIATGWNLYNHNAGYARVCKYAFGYRIEGTYTSLQYSATESGAKSEIVVTDGNFDIPDDGFVWVNGGSSSDTAVFATWEDWSEGHDGDFEAYVESVVDLSTVMASKFPYGLLKAGSVVDELDLNLGQAISRVERMTYSEANLAVAKASGREYEYDEDYIYLARASASVSTVSIDGSFTASDHGIEFFANADAPVTAEILYGLNLKNRLEREVLLKSRQPLTEAIKAQVRDNIGAQEVLNSVDLSSGIVWGNSYVTGDNPTGILEAYGKIRSLKLTFKPKNTNTDWTLVCTLPAGSRPSSFWHFPAPASDFSEQKLVRVKANGEVEVFNRGTKTYYVNLTYIATA